MSFFDKEMCDALKEIAIQLQLIKADLDILVKNKEDK